MELRPLHTSHRYDETEQWNGNVVILIKYSSPEVVISEAVVFDAVSDENLMKMLTFPLQGYNVDDQNMVVLPIVGGRLAMLTEENLPSKYNVNAMKSV